MNADGLVTRLIAQMMRPARPIVGLVAPDPSLYAAILEGCARNKVPLLSLPPQEGLLRDLYASSEFRQAAQQEQRRWQALRREYLPIAEQFASQGIRPVLIKSTGLAPSFPYKSDNLDVLVPLAEGERARQILLDNRYLEIRNVEEPHKFLFRKFHGGQSVSAIHLHEFVGWGTGFMRDADVLADARLAPDDAALWIPAPEHALLITMAHAFYEDKSIKLGDLWKVMHVLQLHVLNWQAVYRQASQRGWREGLDTCICLWAELEQALYGQHSFPPSLVAEAWRALPDGSRAYMEQRLPKAEVTFPFDVSFRFSKRHYYGKVWRDQEISPRQKFIDAARHSLAGIKRRLPMKAQPGMVVSFSGMDGSGKTTYAEMLRQVCEECEIDARVVWSRGASSPLTDRIIALLKPLVAKRSGLDTASDTRRAKLERKRSWLRQPLLRWGWETLLVTDLVLRYWRHVAWPCAWGKVVLCDRYYYDALVELALTSLERARLPRAAARAFRWLCPRPAVAFLLIVSPQEALRRKPDETLEVLQDCAALYDKLKAEYALLEIDASGDLAEACDAVTYAALSRYYRDWYSLLAALFWANPMRRAERGER